MVYVDRNSNGRLDESDTGVPGARVSVLRNGAAVAEMRTGADGHFRFDELTPSIYLLQANDPPGYAILQPQQYVAVNPGLTVTHNFAATPSGNPAHRTFLPLLTTAGR